MRISTPILGKNTRTATLRNQLFGCASRSSRRNRSVQKANDGTPFFKGSQQKAQPSKRISTRKEPATGAVAYSGSFRCSIQPSVPGARYLAAWAARLVKDCGLVKSIITACPGSLPEARKYTAAKIKNLSMWATSAFRSAVNIRTGFQSLPHIQGYQKTRPSCRRFFKPHHVNLTIKISSTLALITSSYLLGQYSISPL